MARRFGLLRLAGRLRCSAAAASWVISDKRDGEWKMVVCILGYKAVLCFCFCTTQSVRVRVSDSVYAMWCKNRGDPDTIYFWVLLNKVSVHTSSRESRVASFVGLGIWLWLGFGKDYTIGTLHYNWISHAHVCAFITGLQHVQCSDSVIMLGLGLVGLGLGLASQASHVYLRGVPIHTATGQGCPQDVKSQDPRRDRYGQP